MCLAIPARILSIHGQRAEAAFGSVRRTISLQLLPNARVGDYVLVHTGFAISIIDPEEARHTLNLLEQMGQAAANGEPLPESSARHEPENE